MLPQLVIEPLEPTSSYVFVRRFIPFVCLGLLVRQTPTRIEEDTRPSRPPSKKACEGPNSPLESTSFYTDALCCLRLNLPSSASKAESFQR
jgi:hypothetical protein